MDLHHIILICCFGMLTYTVSLLDKINKTLVQMNETLKQLQKRDKEEQ